MEHSDQKCGASMINTKQHYSLHGSVQVIFGIKAADGFEENVI